MSMNKMLKRRDALKALTAIGGVLALPGIALGQFTTHRNGNGNGRFVSGWSYQGQPCTILQQGSMLLLINEVGSVASGVWTGKNTFTVLGGSGWDAGLTAQVVNLGRTINWSNNTAWNQDGTPRRPQNLEGGWLYQGQPCAIFQQGDLFILVNETGAIGNGIWTASNSLTIIGGSGWDLGLVAQAADKNNTLNWSNGTVWMRS